MSRAPLGIEPVRIGRDVAEEVQRMSRDPGLARRGFERAVAKTPCVVESAEHQPSSTQPQIAPSAKADVSTRVLTLLKLLPFPQAAQGLARLAELRQDPGGGGDRVRKQ